MSSTILTKNHVVHSIQDQAGNKDINYFQNTIQDVLIDEDAEENIRGHITYYAVCNTPIATAAKEIFVVDSKSEVLAEGATFNVTFPDGNTAPPPVTLSVNGSDPYVMAGIDDTNIIPDQTVILLFTGTEFIISGASGVRIESEDIIGNDPSQDRFLTFVKGETGSAHFKIDKKIKITKDGLVTELGHSTANFDVDVAELIKDVRATHNISPKDKIRDTFRKIRHVFDALGKMAFRDNISTSDLDPGMKERMNLAVYKKGTINGSAVNDLYNNTDFSGTVGTKALDAAVGKTLQSAITTINSKLTTNVPFPLNIKDNVYGYNDKGGTFHPFKSGVDDLNFSMGGLNTITTPNFYCICLYTDRTYGQAGITIPDIVRQYRNIGNVKLANVIERPGIEMSNATPVRWRSILFEIYNSGYSNLAGKCILTIIECKDGVVGTAANPTLRMPSTIPYNDEMLFSNSREHYMWAGVCDNQMIDTDWVVPMKVDYRLKLKGDTGVAQKYSTHKESDPSTGKDIVVNPCIAGKTFIFYLLHGNTNTALTIHINNGTKYPLVPGPGLSNSDLTLPVGAMILCTFDGSKYIMTKKLTTSYYGGGKVTLVIPK